MPSTDVTSEKEIPSREQESVQVSKFGLESYSY